MLALARGAEAKDMDTADHVGRVQRLSEVLAGSTGMDTQRASDVGWSAMLHDVGKLHVPDKILLKPGPLTAAEWKIMRKHTIWGAEILANGDGFEIARTRVNMMLIPGQVGRLTHVFREPGEYLLICHEYCGMGHHTMSGKVIVE